MAKWYSVQSGSTPPASFLGSTLLVELYDRDWPKNRVLAFVSASAEGDKSPLTGIAPVVGRIVSYIPLEGGTPIVIPEGTLATVELTEDTAKLKSAPKAGFRLRLVDKRGVPWTIAGYVTPPEGYEKQAVAWTNEYGADQTVVEANTLDALKGEINKVVEVTARNLPELGASTALRDDAGPILVNDDGGPFLVHGVTKGDTQTYYAARITPFSTEIIGPASSLDQIKADVAAYRKDAARAAYASLGFDDGGSRGPSYYVPEDARAEAVEGVDTPATTPPQDRTSSETKDQDKLPTWAWWALGGVAAVVLLSSSSD